MAETMTNGEELWRKATYQSAVTLDGAVNLRRRLRPCTKGLL